MKDQLLIVVEALLMAKAELNTHYSRRVKNAPRTIERLKAVLFDPKVSKAIGVLTPDIEAPNLVPAKDDEQQDA
jgi:hypothetical protein